MDPELPDVVARMAADLRRQIQTGNPEKGNLLAETCLHIVEVGMSLRNEVRAISALLTARIEKMDRLRAEQAGWSDGLEGRVLRLEARVTNLDENRKPRRPRRQPSQCRAA